jgi:hypothetical protein
MGRSRGGLTTKIHALVDADGNNKTDLPMTVGLCVYAYRCLTIIATR